MKACGGKGAVKDRSRDLGRGPEGIPRPSKPPEASPEPLPCVILWNCACLTGQLHLEATAEQRQGRHEREVQIAELKAAIKKETQFNRQVGLNMQMKQVQQQRTKVTEQL